MEGATLDRPEVGEGSPSPGFDPAQPRRGPLRAAVKTMRPKEWIKNLLVFAGLLFSGQFDDPSAIASATITFLAFCAVASAGYRSPRASSASRRR